MEKEAKIMANVVKCNLCDVLPIKVPSFHCPRRHQYCIDCFVILRNRYQGHIRNAATCIVCNITGPFSQQQLTPELLNRFKKNPRLVNKTKDQPKVVQGHLSNDSKVQPDLSNKTKVPPDLSNKTKVQPAPSNKTKVQPPNLSNKTKVQPDSSNKTVVQPNLSNKTKVQPDSANKTKVQPNLPSKTDVQPDSSNKTKVQPNLPNKTDVQPDLSNKIVVQPNLPNKIKVNVNQQNVETIKHFTRPPSPIPPKPRTFEQNVTIETLFRLPTEEIQQLLCGSTPTSTLLRRMSHISSYDNRRFSKVPMKCPHNPCNRMIAATAFSAHFRHDHSEIPSHCAERNKEFRMDLDVSIVEFDQHFCVSQMTVYDRNPIDVKHSLCPQSVINTCDKLSQSVPMETFWVMVTGSPETQPHEAFFMVWVYCPSVDRYFCTLEVSSKSDSISFSAFCEVHRASHNLNYRAIAEQLHCLMVSRVSMGAMLEEAPKLNLRITIH